MNFEFLNFFLAFIEGLSLIASPCILPILPILLAGSIEGGKKRPLGIILGFTVVFTFFTFFSHYLIQITGINLNIVRDIAFILIGLFGVVMISDYLTEKLSAMTQRLANIGANINSKRNPESFWSGFLLGGLVSLIWTPCAGPILADALVQIAIQKTAFATFMALFFFSLGSIIPMIIIALLGKKIFHKLTFFKQRAVLLRKIFGYIIIISALFLAYVSYFNPNLLAFSYSRPTSVQTYPNTPTLIDELSASYPAPPLAGISAWINSNPLTLAQLKGKVVLVDFWTYSCINCIRTLPTLIAWDKAYRDKGLVIIGVHTPEFEFEKNLANVTRAVKNFGIKYPVALDSQYSTWNNYHNQYWPADYLIDKNGNVVFEQFGEGNAGVIEHNIRTLLGLNPTAEKTSVQENVPSLFNAQTPETYLGFARADRYQSPQSPVINNVGIYTFPSQLSLDNWALQGKWIINAQNIVAAEANAAIALYFQASHVYVVAGHSNSKPITVRVLLNDVPITTNAGADVKNSLLTITDERLYEIARFPKPTQGKITLIISAPGAELYTFTFG